MQLNFTKPETPLLKRWREKRVGSSPPQLNHAPHLWAMQQQICWAALCWGSRRGKQRCPMPLPRVVGEAQAATPPECPAVGQSCRGLRMEIHSGTDADREPARVQPQTVLNLLVNLTEVTPGPCNDLTACTICIMYVTSIETDMMWYTNECCSGKDMH